MAAIYFDTEFRAGGSEPVCLVALVQGGDDAGEHRFDLRPDGAGQQEFRSFFARHASDIWIAWFAEAELVVLHRMGLDIRPLRVVDLWAEWIMVERSHPMMLDPATRAEKLRQKRTGQKPKKKARRADATPDETPEEREARERREEPKGRGLLFAASKLGVPLGALTPAHKEAMRRLILDHDPAAHDANAMQRIMDYCASDVTPLPALLQAIAVALGAPGPGWNREQALLRGQHVRNCVYLQEVQPGIPIDPGWCKHLMDHRGEVQHAAMSRANQHYQLDLYRYEPRRLIKAGARKGQWQEAKWTRKDAAAAELLERLGLLEHWPRTDAGNPKLDDDTLKEQASLVPELELFHETRRLVTSLSGHDALNWLQSANGDPPLMRPAADGTWRLRPRFRPYGTVTGRSAPQPGKGYLFGLAAPLRSMIRVPPGHVLHALDYKSQEVAIAAWISGDEQMRDDYLRADVYLSLAQAMGLIPAEADIAEKGAAKRWAKERKLVKPILLGLSYGMGQAKMTADLLVAGAGTESECRRLAANGIRTHKERLYRAFWRWVERNQREAERERAMVQPEDGWLRYVDPDLTPATQIQNWRIQAAGALVMRRVLDAVVREGLPLVASAHDGFYLMSPEAEAATNVAAMQRIMREASDSVTTAFVAVAIEVETYGPGAWFMPAKDQPVLAGLWSKYASIA